MEERKHSKLGVASFVTGLVSSISLPAVIIFAGYLSTTGGEDDFDRMMIGLGLLFLLVTAVVAFILGIAALFQKNVQKAFAAVGIFFSSFPILGAIILMMIGFAL
jgi:hypothetical protein